MDSVSITAASVSDRALLVRKIDRPVDRMRNVLRFQCDDVIDSLGLAPNGTAYSGRLPTIDVIAERKKFGALFFPMSDKPVRGALTAVSEDVRNLIVDERVLPLLPEAKRLLAAETDAMHQRMFALPFRGRPVLSPTLQEQGYFASSLSFNKTIAGFSIVYHAPGTDRRLGRTVCWCRLQPPAMEIEFFPQGGKKAEMDLLNSITDLASGGTGAILTQEALHHIRVKILTKCIEM